MTLTDALGRDVSVAALPGRIVSAAPVVTEILFALGAGDRVVAVTDQSDYPPEARERSKIGGFWTPSVEKTLGARPDLVIGSRGNPPDFVETLRRSGCTVFTVDPQRLDDIYRAIRDIATLVGEREAGEELAADMQARLAAVSEQIRDVADGQRPTAFIVSQVNPVWTAGAGTFQDDAIRAAGGRNIAADVESFRTYSTERLLAEDPDFLILSTMEGDPEGMKRAVLGNPVLRRLSAVRQGRILVLEADHITRAGPRIVEAVEAMALAFYPERFGGADR